VFLAPHFHELGFDVLDHFECDIVSAILSCESFVVSSEDSLFQFIVIRFAKNDGDSRLFEFVAFACLSRDSKHPFINSAWDCVSLMTS